VARLASLLALAARAHTSAAGLLMEGPKSVSAAGRDSGRTR